MGASAIRQQYFVQQHGIVMIRPFFLLLLLGSMVLVSCSSNPGDADVDSYDGDNGVILNGSGYENLELEFQPGAPLRLSHLRSDHRLQK